MKRWLCLALVCASCGGDNPPPPEITAQLDDGVLLRIRTSPLELSIERGGQVILDQPRFVEVGTLTRNPNPRTYLDPAAPDSVGVEFQAPERATAWDGKTLTLDGGAKLSIDGGTLTLDVGAVKSAQMARFVLPVAQGEELYGFGELEDTPASSGVVREMQLRIDMTSESATNELHVPVPLAMYPGRQLAFFAAERRVGAFDVAKARPAEMLVTFATQKLELHVIPGAPLVALDRYTTLTGKPIVPPDWAFFPMQWRNEIANAGEMLDDAMQMRANHIPDSTMWIDNPWQTGYNTFQFDPARVPDPAGLVQQLTAMGYRALVWSTPYVDTAAPTDSDWQDGDAHHYFVTDSDGKTFNWPWANGPGALVDFSAPGATDWWRQRIQRVVDLGFHGFKLDYGEDLVPELVGIRTPFLTHDGGTDVVHGIYAKGYHQAYLGALPDGDGFLLTRASAWGGQVATTCIWPGDLDADFSRRGEMTSGGKTKVGGLPSAIAMGVSLSASGFPFFGSDIGGFRGTPTTENLVRWAEYATLGTIMQLGGGGPDHNPWDTSLYGPEALPIYQKYSRLHADLFPYLYSMAKAGRPPVMAPGLLYPGHPYEDDFLLGDALFVAPVVIEGATSRTVTLPPGDWVDFWTGQLSHGGGPVTVSAPLDTLPLWRKVGAIVPLLATPVDTVLPATASGVLSLSDPVHARELRVLSTPSGDSTFALYDGAQVETHEGVMVKATAGQRHQDFRFELDWQGRAAPTSASVPAVADRTALEACAAPGCWFYDAATNTAFVRLVGGGSATIQ